MKLNSTQLQVLNACREGKSVAVFGEAGTGKTYLRDKIAGLGPSIILGPTGASVANKSGAMTIARFMGATYTTINDPTALALQMRPPPGLAMMRIVIDEISMVPADLFAALNSALQRTLQSTEAFGGLNVALFGDMFQLRPPTDAGFFFESAAFESLCLRGLEVHSLTEQMRQQSNAHRAEEMAVLMKDARRGKLGAVSESLLHELNNKPLPPKALHLYATCAAASAHNKRALDQHPGTAITVGKAKFKLHAPVVATRNKYENGKLAYANGDRGLIVGFATNAVAIILAGQRHYVRAINGNIPLALGFASTVHKAQGRTCSAVVVHGDGIFDAGQAYVAISRVRCFANLVTRGLHADDFKIDYPLKLTTFAKRFKLT